MKTAISIPDETFERATRQAQALGVSRSEFFTQAARRYLHDLEITSITAQIDVALTQIAVVDDSSAFAVGLGHRLLAEDAGADDEW